MEMTKQYLTNIHTLLDRVLETQSDSINRAVAAVANTLEQGGMVYAFGTGHSHMISEEMYIRAGGLALVHAILPQELMLSSMATKSTMVERLEGYAPALVELYKIDEKDTLLVVSNSGRNAVPVEMCLAAKAKGASVVALTSMKHSAGSTSRHSSGKKMYEVADVVIDNRAEKGDAGLWVEGLDLPIGGVSDAIGVAIAQALTTEVVERMIQAGVEPPVFCSSNVDGGDEKNAALYEKYYGYWK